MILGVRPGASGDEVRSAWRSLAARYHPDRFVTATASERRRAEQHAAVINAAYDEIRSGRAAARLAAEPAGTTERVPNPMGAPWQNAPEAPADPWLDDEVVRRFTRTLKQRQRRSRRRLTWRLAAFLLIVGVAAAGIHWSLSQEYSYDVVWDGQGNIYNNVDCGNRYDSGSSTAAQLREQAASSPGSGGAALRHQAEVIEDVCGDWRGTAQLMAIPAIGIALFLAWYLFIRRAAPARIGRV